MIYYVYSHSCWVIKKIEWCIINISDFILFLYFIYASVLFCLQPQTSSHNTEGSNCVKCFLPAAVMDSLRVNASHRQMQQCRNHNSTEQRLGDHLSAICEIHIDHMNTLCYVSKTLWLIYSGITMNINLTSLCAYTFFLKSPISSSKTYNETETKFSLICAMVGLVLE